MRRMRGFTLIELLVVMVIIGILVAMALPNYMRAKDKARESQVQANVHIIQMAVERYATDNNGEYPKWLLGGDYSDWNTVQLFSPKYCPGLGPPSPPCGDGDALLEYGFLSQYPRNPFMRNVNTGRNLQVLDCPNPRYSDNTPSGVNFCDYGQGLNGPGVMGTTCNSSGAGGFPSCRKVGGIGNNLMWDVSEGVFGSLGGGLPQEGGYTPNRGTSIMLVRGWAGHPPWTILCSRGAANCDQASSASPIRRISPWLVGNFYYYPITANMNMYFRTVPREPMVGYYIAGYGAIWNIGHDVYDAFGDYEEGKLFCDGDAYGDCVINPTDTRFRNEGNNLSAPYHRMYCKSNGPDGQRDGVIVVVSSGRDRSALMDRAKAGCGQ